jgi:hypothetical protein
MESNRDSYYWPHRLAPDWPQINIHVFSSKQLNCWCITTNSVPVTTFLEPWPSSLFSDKYHSKGSKKNWFVLLVIETATKHNIIWQGIREGKASFPRRYCKIRNTFMHQKLRQVHSYIQPARKYGHMDISISIHSIRQVIQSNTMIFCRFSLITNFDKRIVRNWCASFKSPLHSILHVHR